MTSTKPTPSSAFPRRVPYQPTSRQQDRKAAGDDLDRASSVVREFRSSYAFGPDRDAHLMTKMNSIMTPVMHLNFYKPDFMIYSKHFLYEINRDNATRLFYVIRRKACRFQKMEDIILVDPEGETLLKLVSVRGKSFKVNVLIGDTVIGSVVKIRLNFYKPKFQIRDADKKRIATVQSKRPRYCCQFLQKLLCPKDFGVFFLNRSAHFPKKKKCKCRRRKKADVEKVDEEDQVQEKVDPVQLATIVRNISFNNIAAHDDIIEIQFHEDVAVNTNLKCLAIAAAYLIDNTIFNIPPGRSDLQIMVCIFCIMLVILLIAFLYIFLSIHL